MQYLQMQYQALRVVTPTYHKGKYLGVVFTSDCGWSTYIDMNTTKAHSILGFSRTDINNAPDVLKNV